MENTKTETNAGTIATPALITIKRANIADALRALKFKQGKRSGRSIPILNYIAAEVTAAGLVLKTTDLEAAVTYTLEAITNKAAAGARFCLSFAGLETAIKGAPKIGDIEIKYSIGAGAAAVSWPELAGGSFPVDCLAAEDFPIIPEVKTEKPEHLRACVDYNDFRGLVDALLFSASSQDDRHFLNGIFFDGKEAVTTDGRRLAILPFPFTFNPIEKENGFIIPSEACRRAGKAGGAGTLTVYNDRAYFIGPKMVITTRLIQGNFPAYKQIMPKTWDIVATIDGAALLPVLSSLPGINKSLSMGVTFLFTAAGYELYFKDEKIAAFPILEGAGHFKKKAFKIAFNPAFVRDILETAPGSVQIRLNGDCQPGGLCNSNGADYLIMPLRTDKAGGGLAARLEELAAAAKPAEGVQDAPKVPEAPEGQAEAPAASEPVQTAPAAVPEAPTETPEPDSGKYCEKCGKPLPYGSPAIAITSGTISEEHEGFSPDDSPYIMTLCGDCCDVCNVIQNSKRII